MLIDVDWQHNFKSFFETVRVKISCKDPSRIPEERLFGIHGKIYRFLIELEPALPAAEPVSSTNPSSGTHLSVDAEHRDTTSEDAGSNRGSRTGSDHGLVTGSGANVPRIQSLGHNHMADDN